MLSTLTMPHRHKHTQPALRLNVSHPSSTCPQAVCRLAAPSPEEAGDGWAGNFARLSDSKDLLSSSSTCLSGENTELSPPDPLWVPGRAQTSSSILVRGRLTELVNRTWAGRLVHIPEGGAWKKPPRMPEACETAAWLYLRTPP